MVSLKFEVIQDKVANAAYQHGNTLLYPFDGQLICGILIVGW